MLTLVEPRRYCREELLAIRDSPLVKKPDGLPPIEEWMGPPPTQLPKPGARSVALQGARGEVVRPRTDGDLHGNGEENGSKSVAINRRSMFDTRLNSRSSIPEDIILGPPKLNFASASSAKKMAFDFDSLGSTGLSSPAVIDEDQNSSPRFDNRFRLQRDKDREKGGNMDRNDTRTSQRRGFNKDETEANGETGRGGVWTHRGARKSFGQEDGDRFRRGNNEIQKDRPQRYDNFARDRMNNRTKRDESSWILDDNRDRDRAGDREKVDNPRGDRDNEQKSSRDFRSFNRDYRSRDDDRNQRVEKDPEWLDAAPDDPESRVQAHSMEEFQRWKARMKAAGAKKPKTPVEETLPVEEEKPSPGTPTPTIKEEKPELVVEVPLSSPSTTVVENGVDRFFNLWNPPSSVKSPDAISTPERPPAVGRSSKFSSFFSSEQVSIPSPRQPTPQQPQPQFPPVIQSQRQPTPNSHTDPSSNEDKEGFRRILQMLGGSSGPGGGGPSVGSPAPNASQTPPIHSPLPPLQLASSKPPASPGSPPLQHSQPTQQQQHAPHTPYTPIQPSPSPLQNLPMPPRDANSDFLLGLMRQSNNQPPASAPLQSLNNHSYGGPSQMPPPPQISTSPQTFQRPQKNLPTSPIFDDPAIAGFRQRPSQEPLSMVQSRIMPPPIEQHPPNWFSQSHQGPQVLSQAQQGPQGPQGLQGLQGQQQSLHGPGSQSLQSVSQQLLRNQQLAPPPGFSRSGVLSPHGPMPPALHGPPPPPPFMGPPPSNSNNIPPPFQLSPIPPNFPPGGHPQPPPFFGINGPLAPPPYSMPFSHDGSVIGLPPHFGFPHDPLKSPQHHVGPGKPTKY